MLIPRRIVLLLSLGLPLLAGAADRPVNFAREILPILSDKCYACHGPDTKKDTELRLDSPAAATADRGGYRAVDTGSPEQSELLKRIFDREDPMPPADAERQLSEQEKELLKRWIMQGGKYSKHWAFVPPARVNDRSIDYFVERQLKGRGIGFAPPANRKILARRAALVLTGLPPEPKQLADFLSDSRKDAYSRYVNELLASSRFGEHHARYWLDAVRYGDTHGLHLDNRRGIYPYRDWVVRAFNENLPFDKFIEWQVAGDLLPDPTLEQLLATGFVRMNPSTGEGGAIEAEFQAKNNMDRVETLGTALLGASLVCSRCHTHKYDPYTQTEYYRMMAFFNNTAEPALDKNAYRYGPTVLVPKDAAAWDAWNRLKRDRSELLSEVTDLQIAELKKYPRKIDQWKTSGWKLSGNVKADSNGPADKSYKDVKGLPGQNSDKLPKSNQARWLKFNINVPVHQTLWMSFDSGPGYEVLVDDVPKKVDSTFIPLRLSRGEHGIRIKLMGTPDRYNVRVELQNPWLEFFKGETWSDCSERDRLRMLADGEGPPFGALSKKARELQGRVSRAEAATTTSLIAKDLDSPRETRLLQRGEYHLPVGDPLKPGVFEAMSQFPEGAPTNRLGLAKWLTAKSHPLVARVLVNRIWQSIYGHAIVRTPEEFGRQGDQPTHPELLDWLAVEFIESGWDQKHLLRLMLNSRTFRQSSRWREGVEDPENRLFARGPRYRLDAEVLRDVGLWASGLLDRHVGGEGVKPYQPEGMWKALTHPASNTVEYKPDAGKKVYRRSLYVYWKRTSPHPMMTLFDAPSRETSCVARSRSNTPVQSLGLFNEIQRLEMARKLAERIMYRHRDQDRLDHMFQLLACRPASKVETDACLGLLSDLKQRYQKDKNAALALLSRGDSAFDRKLDPVEFASWAQVAATVLASDVSILLY